MWHLVVYIPPHEPCLQHKKSIFPTKRAVYSYSIKRALCSTKIALYCGQNILPAITAVALDAQVWSVTPRIVYSTKRAVCSTKKNIYSTERALHSMYRAYVPLPPKKPHVACWALVTDYIYIHIYKYIHIYEKALYFVGLFWWKWNLREK